MGRFIKFFMVILLMASLTSCSFTPTSEDLIKSSFKKYVKTEFGDPDSFLEITDIQATDTFNTKTYKEILQQHKNNNDYIIKKSDSINRLMNLNVTNKSLVAITRSNRSKINPVYRDYYKALNDNNETMSKSFNKILKYGDIINCPDTTAYIYELKCRVLEKDEKVIRKYSVLASPDFSTIKFKEGELATTDMPLPDFMDNIISLIDTYSSLIDYKINLFNAEKKLLDTFIECGYKPEE